MKRKKTEFKKITLILIIIFCMVCVVWSFVLASVGSYEVNETLAGSMFAAVVGSYISYVLASYGEKNSRNKYDIDENGNKRTETHENAREHTGMHGNGGEKGDD